jgi:galactitol PTS system EIIB component
MKTILVACGSGIATSTIICESVKTLLLENNIKAEIIQCSIGDIDGRVDDADLIVTSTKLTKEYRVPVVSAISLLTGVGRSETESAILENLK